MNKIVLLIPKDQRIGSRGIEIAEAILQAAIARAGKGEAFINCRTRRPDGSFQRITKKMRGRARKKGYGNQYGQPSPGHREHKKWLNDASKNTSIWRVLSWARLLDLCQERVSPPTA